MHAIVTTPGFIIDSRSYSEADKLFSIFTKDLGLVRAVAQGIRLEKSKLRYHVQENSLSIFSLVRGRDMWRLTSAQEMGDVPQLIRSNAGKELLARISLLLRRVLHGEEANQNLFAHIEACSQFLALHSNPNSSSHSNLNNEQLQTLESLTVIRALNALGYVGNDAEMADCLQNSEISQDFLNQIGPKRAVLNKHVNKAIKESHL